MITSKHVAYLFVSLALLLGTQIASAQETERYSGTGRAILGTGMTLEQTEQLALNAAKRDALEKFGTHVQSEATWETRDTERGSTDEFRRDLRVFAASVVQLVEDTKTIERELEGETIRFVAHADFDVDVARFNERLEQYLDNPEAEDLESLVDQYTQIDSQMQSESDPDRAYSLYRDQQSVEENIEDAFQRLDGGGIVAGIEQSRQRKFGALIEHIELIRDRGHLSDIFNVSLQQKSVQDSRENISIRYDVEISESANVNDFSADLKRLRDKWYTSSNPTLGTNRIEHLSTKAYFYIVGTNESSEILFYKLIDVVAVNYSRASRYTLGRKTLLPRHRSESVSTELQVPTQVLERVTDVGVIPSHSRLSRKDGFERSSRNSTYYLGGQTGRLSVNDIYMNRDEFEQAWNAYANQFKEYMSQNR